MAAWLPPAQLGFMAAASASAKMPMTTGGEFFVRTFPPADLGDTRRWTVAIDGAVARPARIGIDELRRLAVPRGPHLVECSGNSALYRYALDDGFGFPSVAFIICTFWLVEAMSLLGERDEARQLLETVLPARSPLGLLAEDVDPESLQLWGYFPQAYSHVGLIHAAFAASPRWNDVL